jgi:hypothetical protein
MAASSPPSRTEPSESDVVAEHVLRHATRALYGREATVNSCTRDDTRTINLRLRATGYSTAGDTKEESSTRRALRMISTEVCTRLPLVRCTLMQSNVDGVDEVDVSVPGPTEAWRRARRHAASGALPSLLGVIALGLTLSSVALVAYPFVR